MKTIQTLTEEQSKKLLAELLSNSHRDRHTNKGDRNYAMALLMLDAGLRVGELVHLHIADLLINNEPVTTLYVHPGIAMKQAVRYVPLKKRIQEAITSMKNFWWNPQLHKTMLFAFYAIRPTFFLSVRQVERIIKRASMIALGKPIHPHILRHTFATNLMRVTSTRVVQELLGHKKLSSTQIYTHPNSQDLKEAIEKLE